jgi:hypothetical protein
MRNNINNKKRIKDRRESEIEISLKFYLREVKNQIKIKLLKKGMKNFVDR